MLTNLTVVIILQCIHLSNHRAKYLKMIQCYMSIAKRVNYIPIKLENIVRR